MPDWFQADRQYLVQDMKAQKTRARKDRIEANRKFSKEVCYILSGQRRGHIWHGCFRNRRLGEPTSVEFDWEWALRREEHKGDIIGFYHTHPAGSATPSWCDVQTMRAWVSCLGKPLLCVIENEPHCGAYLFETDESDGVRLPEVQRFPGNVIVAVES